MEEDTELVELETAPEAGVTGITVARDRQGLYIAKAPKSLRIHQGDRLLSARVFFEGAPPEDVARVLEGARSCKVSLCLRRRTPATRVPLGGPNSDGHQGKVARLSIPILTPSKKPPLAPGTVSAAPTSAVAVEFALPKLPKLVKSRSAAEPAPTATSTAALPAAEPKWLRATPSRLTVKEAAASKTPVMEEPPVKPEVPGIAAEVPVGTSTRIPAVEVAAPKVSVGLSLASAAPPAAPQAKEPALRLPQLEVAVPALSLPGVMPEPGTTINQPQIKLGEGDTPSSSRKRGGSPVLKTKLLNFSTAPGEDEEGDTSTRRGFAGIRVPSIGIAVPSTDVELVSELGVPKPEPAISGEQPWLEVKLPMLRSESPPAAPARLTFPATVVPSIDIAVPCVDVGLALPAGVGTAAVPDEGDAALMPDVAARFAKGLRKLSLELEPMAPLPAVEIATPARFTRDVPTTGAKPKLPKFTLPWLGLSLTKLKMGSDGNEYPPASHIPTATPAPPGIAITGPTVALDLALGTIGATSPGVKLKVPKLSLVPFSVKDGDKGAGGGEGPQDAGAVMKLPGLGIGGSGRDDRRSAEPGSPRTPRLRVPQVGIALPVTGSRRVPSLPKLPTEMELGGGVKLPKFGGSSPDIRIGGDPKLMRRGESAESLSIGMAGRKIPESPSMIRSKLKTRGRMGDRGAQPLTPWFTVPAVHITMPVTQPEDPVSQKIPKTTGMPALKVPALELAPPGMEETTRKDIAPGRPSRVKLPKFSTGFSGSGLEGEGKMRMGSVKKAVLVLVKPKEKGEESRVVDPHPHINGEVEGKARRWHWVPRVGFSPGGSPLEPPITQPKGGKMQLPNVELCPGEPEFNQQPAMTQVTPHFNLGGFRGEGTPKFQLPKLALSPQP